MKGSSFYGRGNQSTSPMLTVDPTDPTDTNTTEKRTQSLSDEQTDKDIALINENTNQPSEWDTSKEGNEYVETKDDTVKAVKRQNRLDAQEMSKGEINKALKERQNSGRNKSDKSDVGFLGRVFGSKKKLATRLAHQQNVNDI